MKNPVFAATFAFTLQHEGKSSLDQDDPGNWTGGMVGVGVLKGTKYGISAKAYPYLDIQSLTLADVKEIHYRDYWMPSGAWRFADHAPDLAARLYDLAVNCGVSGASTMLQRAVNTVCTGSVQPRRRAKWRQQIVRRLKGKSLRVDGTIGPITAEVIRACPHRVALHAALRGEAYNHYRRLDPASIPGWLNRLGAST